MVFLASGSLPKSISAPNCAPQNAEGDMVRKENYPLSLLNCDTQSLSNRAFRAMSPNGMATASGPRGVDNSHLTGGADLSASEPLYGLFRAALPGRRLR